MIIPEREYIEKGAIERLEEWFNNSSEAEVLFNWESYGTYYFTVKIKTVISKSTYIIYFIRIFPLIGMDGEEQWMLSEDGSKILK